MSTSKTTSATQISPTRLLEVRRRRVIAFCVDYLVIALICVPVAAVIAILGILTLGLGWLAYGIMVPLVAVLYFGLTIGGEQQASVGMRMFAIRLERLDGGNVDFFLAVLHTVLFWAGNFILSPVVLVASLFSKRKRLLQDLLLGTMIVRSDA